MKKSRQARTCPCGSGLPYAQCCGRFHAGEPAPDARSLMASRYSAYALLVRTLYNDLVGLRCLDRDTLLRSILYRM